MIVHEEGVMADSKRNLRKKFQRIARETTAIGEDQATSDWEPIISIGTAARIAGLSVSALR
jgi:hypothetical protein